MTEYGDAVKKRKLLGRVSGSNPERKMKSS